MKRELKLYAIIVPEQDCAVVWVVKQTHRGAVFANDGSTFFAISGKELQSSGLPEEMIGTRGWFMRGIHTKHDNRPFGIPLDELPDLEAAVREYNKTNGGERSRPCLARKTQEFECRIIE